MHTARQAGMILFGVLFIVASASGDTTPPSNSPAAVEQLQEQLRQQQEQLQALERLVQQQVVLLERLQQQLASKVGEHRPQPESNPGSAPILRAATEDNERTAGERMAAVQMARDVGEGVTSETDAQPSDPGLLERLKGLGNFSFSGDVRLRYEPFFGGTLSQDRHRERIRLRFNAIAKFSEELTGGLRLTSGDELDPISTNQTLTGFFRRKTISLDRAFLRYQPNWFKPLTLTGGKFGYTWYSTELTWDNDLNPEGFSQTLSFDLKNSALKNVTLVGFQLPFRETGNFDDSFVHGGQFQTYWKLSDRVKFSSYAAFYNWHRADPVRSAQLDVTLPVTGGACDSAPGCTVTLPDSASLSGNDNTHVVAPGNRFASKFALLDLIARFDIDTGSPRWPLLLQLDVVNNTRPCTNVFVATCNPRDRSGWWGEVQVGQTQEKNDLNFGYTFIRLEQEAVLGAFNFSDIRQATNVVNHRFNVGYQAYRNVTLNYTLLVGRALRTATSPLLEDWLKRMQFDVIYKF